MLEITRIRAEKDALIEGLKKRGVDFSNQLNQISTLDESWRSKKTEMETIQSESNKVSKEIGKLMGSGKKEEAEVAKKQTAELKKKEQSLKDEVIELEAKIQELLYEVPNVPLEIVPAGKSEEDNITIEEVGQKVKFSGEALPHWELAKKYDLIDFELGVKVTGAGFPFYKGKGAKLQRALINFFLAEAEKAGYTEYIPPLMVNEASGIGTGQLPDKEGQMYHATKDNLYLIPTSEVPLTNIYRDTILPDENFSIKMTGYTPNFRREAGSYGSDVRGLNRLHQFDKVELVRIEHPNNSQKALEEMVNHVKGLLEKLGLQYRILRLCGGDLGFTSAITYDFEVYSAAQEKWLEVSSVSLFETFQANRLKLRFKNDKKKTQLCHTLNGSALALPRILAALLENYQTPEGIEIPEVLEDYLNFKEIK
ncbi:serine--tRNA ligase [Brumimicrobium aurantiacum]|uniref:Serine--tRNA ligase n=1 Tax=Brumimicrobium aurantiacum TaxID=1737063 RepID=A0A3E1F261_9FLAO|nr:serine--tRNA ligase [Brumimicrobium aurantiacum]RFC55905.1 serine--tRNA ligase [Brumimicrobium aurantiacum]